MYACVREGTGLPGDNQSPSFITGGGAPSSPRALLQLSLSDTFGKQPRGKRQNINAV